MKTTLKLPGSPNQRAGGVLAVGNFALTVVLLQKFAEMAAAHIPHWEIIDYANSSKIDAPSGTVRELCHRLGSIRESTLDVPIEDTQGVQATRGARLNGSQVHAIRLPGHVIGAEVIADRLMFRRSALSFQL